MSIPIFHVFESFISWKIILPVIQKKTCEVFLLYFILFVCRVSKVAHLLMCLLVDYNFFSWITYSYSYSLTIFGKAFFLISMQGIFVDSGNLFLALYWNYVFLSYTLVFWICLSFLLTWKRICAFVCIQIYKCLPL